VRVDREQLADFLKTRRETLQPEDVGWPRGARRRTHGLRREEVAALAGMSTDYYSRLEQRRSKQPSDMMVASIARALHLTLDERDHLFRLSGHNAPHRVSRTDHVNPGLMRILDQLRDNTAAQVTTALGETLLQTPLAVALLGTETDYSGMARSMYYRWFTDPDSRRIYPAEDHPMHSRIFTANLRVAYSRDGKKSRAEAIVTALLAASPEFVELWADHEIGTTHARTKRIQHAELGVLELECQILLDPDQSQALLVFTATPGSESYERLQLLRVIGTQRMHT
jgi:transcriptional regulator with XRE-family HTH domain